MGTPALFIFKVEKMQFHEGIFMIFIWIRQLFPFLFFFSSSFYGCICGTWMFSGVESEQQPPATATAGLKAHPQTTPPLAARLHP